MRVITEPARASVDGAAIARSLLDPDAFTTVFDRHFAAVHQYLARRAGRDRADDLASQTFLLAFAHRGRYHDDLGTARPWLLGIATNLLRAERRAEQARLNSLEALVREAPDPIAAADAAGNRARAIDAGVATALADLDAAQRDALLLHVWGELSYAEVATALDIPVGTVRSRISRACATLREILGRRAHA